LFAPDPDAAKRFVAFFTANIRIPHTRKAYARAAGEFAAWCVENEIHELRDMEPVPGELLRGTGFTDKRAAKVGWVSLSGQSKHNDSPFKSPARKLFRR
jgi:hypothetical protein